MKRYHQKIIVILLVTVACLAIIPNPVFGFHTFEGPTELKILFSEIEKTKVSTIDVVEGTTIIWQNDTPEQHTVTSGTTLSGPDGLFDSGIIFEGENFSYTFLEPHFVTYFDQRNPDFNHGIQVYPSKTLEISIKKGEFKDGEQVPIHIKTSEISVGKFVLGYFEKFVISIFAGNNEKFVLQTIVPEYSYPSYKGSIPTYQSEVDFDFDIQINRDFIESTEGPYMLQVKTTSKPILFDATKPFSYIYTDSTVSGSLRIPDWIKNNAGWWADELIDDSDFVQGIQYLIKEGIMKIPPTTPGTGSETNQIPNWIKNNAGWWADELISDEEFVNGIKWLIENGIMIVQVPDYE